MKSVTFVTPNRGKHAEVRRLLAGIDVAWSRLSVTPPEGSGIVASAMARARMASEKLGAPCFVENTAIDLGTEVLRGAEIKRLLEELGDEGFAARMKGRRGEARVVVAYAASPEAEVRVFEGSVRGAFAPSPRGEGGFGWDRVWIPEGFTRTLSELDASTYLVGMRHAPYLDLACHLRGRTFVGSFEAHVTVRAEDLAARAKFRAVCEALGVKCVLIELPDGHAPSQPMTASYHRGTLRRVQEQVHALARALVHEGFEVVRTKIEAHGKNADVPETDDDARGVSDANYFEFHVKLVIAKGADLAGVRSACEAHEAHVSRNANARLEDGGEARFVTLRVARAGRIEAERRFQALLGALAKLGVPMKNRLREYTVYDSNVGLDAAWLAGGLSTGSGA